MFGGAGNDKLYGSSSGDWMHGGDGDDWLYGDGGNDVLLGGNGNDYLDGQSGNDWIEGGAGNDTLLGGSGNDVLAGGEGDDLLKGDDGDDVLLGNAGNDKLYGEDGDDILDGGAGDDELKGGREDDVLLGGAGNDKLYGEDGEDLLDGEDGDDKLYGGDDTDYLLGGAGDDYIDGEKGYDYIEGGLGADTLKSESKDKLVAQEQKSGQLGLKNYYKSFKGEFGQSGFMYEDPTGGNSALDDRPARVWIETYLSTLPSGDAMTAAAPGRAGDDVRRVSEAELAPMVEAAVGMWTEALGEGDARLAALEGMTVTVGDLGGLALAQVNGNTIVIDLDAAGHGWFVDITPGDGSEFASLVSSASVMAESGPAADGMDLLTVLLHEVGHVLGFEHDDASSYGVMQDDLEAGIRFLMDSAGVDQDPDAPVSDAMLQQLAAQAVKLENQGALPSFDLGVGATGGTGTDVQWSSGSDGWTSSNGSKASSNFADYLVKMFRR
jgi:Ca2+-binding RTX toxin-like protein